MVIQENIPLAPLTTLQVGGPARYFLEAKTVAEVEAGIEFSRLRNLPLFILGGGSNLVVSDKGWSGLVLKVGLAGIEEREQEERAQFTVGAGEDWDKFVALTVERNCAGVECLSGIPGSIGGTPVQNVGAYGQEVAETIQSVTVYDTRDGKVQELCREACEFGYRTSTFNTVEKGRYVVLRVTYSLLPGGAPAVKYADLQNWFAGVAQPSLAEVRAAVLEIRARKGMLLITDDPDSRSAGSYFKNPVLSAEQYNELVNTAAAKGLTVPSYPAPGSLRKVSAAWLVEQSGFHKGLQRGTVGTSTKHALALVNRGGASAADILALQEEIQKQVERMWSVLLEPEPVYVGV